MFPIYLTMNLLTSCRMTSGNGSFLKLRRNGEEVTVQTTEGNVYGFYDTTTA